MFKTNCNPRQGEPIISKVRLTGNYYAVPKAFFAYCENFPDGVWKHFSRYVIGETDELPELYESARADLDNFRDFVCGKGDIRERRLISDRLGHRRKRAQAKAAKAPGNLKSAIFGAAANPGTQGAVNIQQLFIFMEGGCAHVGK